MKKLNHREVGEAAEALRDGRISADEFFPKLINLLLAHLENLGLSERGCRYWLYAQDSEEWSAVKHEFQSQQVQLGLLKAQEWLRSWSRKSRAFRIRHTDKIGGAFVTSLPLFTSIIWKYHYSRREPHPKPLPGVDGAAVFYKAQPSERTSADVRRWV